MIPSPARTALRRGFAAIRRLPWISGPVSLVLAAMILGFWWHNVGHLLGDTAPVVSLERAEVRLAPGQTTVIGARELMQGDGGASGEREHVAFSHGANGAVSVRNVARGKRLWLDYADAGGGYSARWRLATGDVIAAASFTLTVSEARSGFAALSLRAGGRETQMALTYGAGGASVTVDGQAPPVCVEPSSVDRMRSLIKSYLASDSRGESRLADLGGALTCLVRDEAFIAAAGVPFRAFSLVARAGWLYLAPGEAANAPRPPVQFRRGAEAVADFSGIGWELDPPGPEQLSHLIIGRTRYRVDLASAGRDRVVTLTPVSKLHRMTQAEAADALADLDAPGVRVVPTPARQPFSRAEMANVLSDLNGPERLVRLGVVTGLLGLGLIAALWRLRRARGWAVAGAVPVALAGLGLTAAAGALALLPEMSAALGSPAAYQATIQATILGYALASVMILLSPAFTVSARLVWLALIGLIALGNLTLTSLAVDSPRTDFAVHVHKNKLIFVDIVPVLAVLIATLPGPLAAAWPRSFFAGGRTVDAVARLVPALAMIAGLVAWGVLGTETGVGGFQPVELGKIALVLLLAHIFAGFMRIDVFYGQRQYLIWLVGAISAAVVFLFFLAAVPFLKSDYSPLLIIVTTFMALAFAFLAPGVIERLGAVIGTLRRRFAAPQRRVKLGWPRGAGLAATLLVLLGLNLALIAAFPALASKLITGAWSIPDNRMEAIALLEKARGGPLRVPAERLLTWYDLDHAKAVSQPAGQRPPDVLHRDLGLQLLNSKMALAQAPCALTRLDLAPDSLLRSPLGERLGPEPAAALCALFPAWPRHGVAERVEDEVGSGRYGVSDLLRVPVIQNDFIATYVLARFGLPIGLAALTFQFAFVAGLVLLAIGLRLKPGVGFQDRAARTGLSIVSAGVAALFAVHWLISWGNAIGVLPVMGQPMTLIAAATSHHLLMALPAIALVLIAARVQGWTVRAVDRSPPR
jgi:cell division protein FtsW (lipid II flippase)